MYMENIDGTMHTSGASAYLLSGKGHSHVGVNEHCPVRDHGNLGH